jgi:hypothetical protein
VRAALSIPSKGTAVCRLFRPSTGMVVVQVWPILQAS